MKKKIIAAVAIILAVGIAVTLVLTRYRSDSKDTEDYFIHNISRVPYSSTIINATPQTELYKVINEHFYAPLPEGKTEKKAILIGYDGCRADILREIDEENSAIALLTSEGASLEMNYCGGVNYPEKNTQKTSTAPGWCSILTGKWADEHGVKKNDVTKSMDTKTLLTSLTEDKVIDSAAFITKWAGHFSRDDATYLEEKKYCEDNKLDVTFNKCKNDDASHAFTLEEIKKEDCPDFIFTIYEHTDSTGHSSGFTYNNPKYKKAFQTSDAFALEDINAIRAREAYESEDWLIIITSDHGGIGTDHGKESIQERITFAVIL